MKKKFKTLLMTMLLGPLSIFAQIYVSPTGTAIATGTLTNPTSLENAIATVQSGQTIFMRGGFYAKSASIIILSTNSGTASANKRVEAYGSEIPVIDFAGQDLADGNRGIILDGDFWYFKGITIQNAGDNGMLLSGNGNTINNCIFKKNRDSGLQLSRYVTSNATIASWPSNNLIVNCEAFDNKDATSENADGFAAKLTCGTGNIFRGCISHNNSDDGWDLYTKTNTGPIGVILFENCVAYNNGTLTDGTSSKNGDKNGFKLGGSGIPVNHIVRRCIAFGNGHHGFTDNNNLGSIEMSNNTSVNNIDANFSFRAGGTHQFRNNVSYNCPNSDKNTGTSVGNSNIWWINDVSTNSGSLSVSSADFASLSVPSIIKNADGSPNLGNFLALASGSDLINAGVTATGISFSGSAPDLGARESGTIVVPNTYSLTTNSNPAAGGSVTRSPNATSYNAGTLVTLTATPAAGYTFTSWSNGASTATTVVTLNANTTISANFSAIVVGQFTLTTTASPTAGGTIAKSPNATTYSSGTVVTVTATPAIGYTFTSWSNGATTSSTTVTMNSNKSITANFTATQTSNVLRIDDSATVVAGYCGAGGSRQNSYSGADGGYYINLSNSAGKGIDYTISVPAAGAYSVKFRYSNGGSNVATTAKVLVNDATAIASLSFPKTTNWTTWTTTAAATVTLRSGINKIRLETSVGAEFANIDWIEIAGNSPTAASCSAAVRMQEEKLSFEASVSPNPIVDQKINLVVNTAEVTMANIELIDVLGHTVISKNQVLSLGQNTINMSEKSIPSGLYFLNIQSDSFRKTIKIIVK
jgi:pectate disaccharide-lyase